MQSGNPITINAGNNTLGLGGNATSYADQSAAVEIPSHQNAMVRPVRGVFSQPAPLAWGNSKRSSVKGPGRDNWNISLFKDFHFSERTGIQLKVETFNTWNHSQITGVNSGVLNGTLGTGAGAYNSTQGYVNGIADPCVFQLGAKKVHTS